jgi:hypothetical protein
MDTNNSYSYQDGDHAAIHVEFISVEDILEIELKYQMEGFEWINTLISFNVDILNLYFNIDFTFYIRLRDDAGWDDWNGPWVITTVPYPTIYTSSYYPIYYPPISDQWVWGAGNGPDINGWEGQANCCLANTLVSIKQVFTFKKANQIKYFSIGWIYGDRIGGTEAGGLNVTDALDTMISDGVPLYTSLPENENNGPNSWYWPDIYYLDDWDEAIGAHTLVNNNYNNAISEANNYKFGNYSEELTGYPNVEIIKSAILNNGCVLMTLLISNTFNNTTSDGIVKYSLYPDDSTGNSHAMAIIGWKKINGHDYWICQNSWGSFVGNYGLYYVPLEYNWISRYYIITDGFPSRPSNFSWTYAGKVNSVAVLGSEKISGYEFYLTDDEWLEICNKVNEFRDYSGLAYTTFTTPVTGANFTATEFNQVRNSIANMNTSGLPTTKVVGQPVYASYLNDLVTCLNAIL